MWICRLIKLLENLTFEQNQIKIFPALFSFTSIYKSLPMFYYMFWVGDATLPSVCLCSSAYCYEF